MYVKHVPALALAAALATVAVTSAAVRFESSNEGTIGGHDIQVTLKPGQNFTIPLPATRYPGAPFTVAIADTSLPAVEPGNGWVMYVTVSLVNGSLSWAGLFNEGGTTVAGSAAPGQMVIMDEICNYQSTCPAVLNAVPVGSAEGLQLNVPDGFPKQSFIISIRGG